MKILTILLIVLIATTVHAINDELLKPQAQHAITNAEKLINQMQQDHLPTKNANYDLNQAKQTLKDTDLLAQVNTNSTNLTQQQIDSLKGKDKTQLTYQNVINQANKVTQIKQALEYASDTINQVKTKTATYKEQNIDVAEAEELILLAEQAFKNEQTDQTIRYTTKASEELEQHKAETIIQKTLIDSSKNYVEKNAIQITIILITLSTIAILAYNYNKKIRAKSRKEKLKAEEKTLKELIIQVQKDRYQTGELDKKTYDLQIKKYEHKLAKVKNELETLKSIKN